MVSIYFMHHHAEAGKVGASLVHQSCLQRGERLKHSPEGPCSWPGSVQFVSIFSLLGIGVPPGLFSASTFLRVSADLSDLYQEQLRHLQTPVGNTLELGLRGNLLQVRDLTSEFHTFGDGTSFILSSKLCF